MIPINSKLLQRTHIEFVICNDFIIMMSRVTVNYLWQGDLFFAIVKMLVHLNTAGGADCSLQATAQTDSISSTRRE